MFGTVMDREIGMGISMAEPRRIVQALASERYSMIWSLERIRATIKEEGAVS